MPMGSTSGSDSSRSPSPQTMNSSENCSQAMWSVATGYQDPSNSKPLPSPTTSLVPVSSSPLRVAPPEASDPSWVLTSASVEEPGSILPESGLQARRARERSMAASGVG